MEYKARSVNHSAKGHRYLLEGKYRAAVKHFKIALEFYPSALVHTFLGHAYSKLGDYGLAIAECRKAIELDPELGNAYNDIGAYLVHTGRLDEALPYIEFAESSKNYVTPWYAHHNHGVLLMKRGMWFEAISKFNDALRLKPDYDLSTNEKRKLQALLN